MHRILKLVAVVFLISACSRTENTMSQEISTAEADVAEGGRGLARLNPEPRLAYEVTLKIKDAPGPFALVNGGAQYDVVNEAECGRINPATGTAGRITSHEDVVLRRIAEDEYRGTVYLDLLQDDDYFGRGVCRWEFTGVSALLKATGAEGETRFLSFMKAGRFTTGESQVLYYPEKSYPRTGNGNFPATGEEDSARFRADIQHQLFSISLSGTEIKP